MVMGKLKLCCASGVCGAVAVKVAQKDSAAEEQVQVVTTCGQGLAGSEARLLRQPLAQTFFGPESVQEELYGRTAHMVEQAVMEGRPGAVLCCGAGGLGKRRGLLGSQAAVGGERPGSVAGRMERALFDHMEAKCTLGDVFIIDVSCLQIGFHPEDRREQLRDLQPAGGPLGAPAAGLRLLPDPLRPGLFAVDGLRRVPVLNRGDLCAALDGALGRCSGEDCHVVVTINIDRIGMDSSSGILTQMRTRLMLVDVAACDDLGRTASAAGTRGLAALRAALRPCRPLKAVRSLSNRRQDSIINLLLDSCVGPSAGPALLLVHLDPGAQGGAATVAGALAFAERVAFPSGPQRAAAPTWPPPGVRFRNGRYVAAAAAGPQDGAAAGEPEVGQPAQAAPWAQRPEEAEAEAQPRQAAEGARAASNRPCCWASASALRGALQDLGRRAAAPACPEREQPESAGAPAPGAGAVRAPAPAPTLAVGGLARVLASGRVGEVLVHDQGDPGLAYKVKFCDGADPEVDWYPADAVACA